MAITTIGAVSYHSRLRVIDMLGLTDREIARSPAMIEGITDTWREIQYNAESVLRRRPDAIFFSTGIRPSSAAEKALFFYEWFHDSYYPYYFRSKPWRESIQNYLRIRPDAPPFRPARLRVDGTEWIDLYSDAHLAKSKERDNPKAVELFRRCMEQSPPQFLWPKEWWAVCRYDEGDTSAVLALQEVVRDDRYATIARGRLADHATRTGDLAAGEEYFREILDVDPDDNLPWIGLAEIARARGDLDEAYRLTTRAVALWNTHPAQLMLHDSLALRAGDLDIAAISFQQAATTSAPDLEARARRGLELVEAVRTGQVRLEDVRAAMGGAASAAPAP
jgi:tetratricopeptide (TPR) repeat protein